MASAIRMTECHLYGRLLGMNLKVAMDRSGRVVIPKYLRDQLGLSEATEFEASLEGSAIRLDVKNSKTPQIKDVNGWPVLVHSSSKSLTDADIQRLRDEQK
jgi:AbrB family looped-hinge helix DNA binding protein